MENKIKNPASTSDIDTLIKAVMDFERIHKFYPVKGAEFNQVEDTYRKNLMNAAFASYELHHAVKREVPPAPDVDKKLLNCQSYQSYINAGWSDKQLIEAGLLPAPSPVPAYQLKSPLPEEVKPCLMAQFIIDLKNRKLPVSTGQLLELYLASF